MSSITNTGRKREYDALKELASLLWAMADTLAGVGVSRLDRRTQEGCVNTLRMLSKNDHRADELLRYGRFNQPEDFEAMSDYNGEMQQR